MLAVAGLLEGVGRQTINDDGLRMLIGISVLVGWLAPADVLRAVTS